MVFALNVETDLKVTQNDSKEVSRENIVTLNARLLLKRKELRKQ